MPQTIYDVVGGRGRSRGSERGLARSGTWRTVMITSGEAPLGSLAENNGGARARLLEFWGGPFGEVCDETAAIVVPVNDLVLEHHGHAGPRVVEHLIRSRADWPGMVARFAQLRQWYQQRAGGRHSRRGASR